MHNLGIQLVRSEKGFSIIEVFGGIVMRLMAMSPMAWWNNIFVGWRGFYDPSLAP